MLLGIVFFYISLKSNWLVKLSLNEVAKFTSVEIERTDNFQREGIIVKPKQVWFQNEIAPDSYQNDDINWNITKNLDQESCSRNETIITLKKNAFQVRSPTWWYW